MSVTIYVKDAPTHKETLECYCVEDARAFDGSKADPECWCCEGTGKRTETIYEGAQPVNMANGNAANVLRLLGIVGDDWVCGSVEAADIPAMRRKMLILRNAQWARSPALRMPSESRSSVHTSVDADGMASISGGCNVIDCGVDDDYLLDKLARIDALLIEAQKLGTRVEWN